MGSKHDRDNYLLNSGAIQTQKFGHSIKSG